MGRCPGRCLVYNKSARYLAKAIGLPIERVTACSHDEFLCVVVSSTHIIFIHSRSMAEAPSETTSVYCGRRTCGFDSCE